MEFEPLVNRRPMCSQAFVTSVSAIRYPDLLKWVQDISVEIGDVDDIAGGERHPIYFGGRCQQPSVVDNGRLALKPRSSTSGNQFPVAILLSDLFCVPTKVRRPRAWLVGASLYWLHQTRNRNRPLATGSVSLKRPGQRSPGHNRKLPGPCDKINSCILIQLESVRRAIGGLHRGLRRRRVDSRKDGRIALGLRTGGTD